MSSFLFCMLVYLIAIIAVIARGNVRSVDPKILIDQSKDRVHGIGHREHRARVRDGIDLAEVLLHSIYLYLSEFFNDLLILPVY